MQLALNRLLSLSLCSKSGIGVLYGLYPLNMCLSALFKGLFIANARSVADPLPYSFDIASGILRGGGCSRNATLRACCACYAMSDH
jgi:hypothetical protein